MTTPNGSPSRDNASLDALTMLKGFTSLRRLAGMYPAGHPAIEQKLTELHDCVRRHLDTSPTLHLDVVRGTPHLDGVSCRLENDAQAQFVRELTELGVDSIHIGQDVTREELHRLAEFLRQLKDTRGGAPVAELLAARQIRNISLGRLVPLDTRWQGTQWPDAPTGPLDPDYAETLALTEHAFNDVADGEDVNLATVRDIVQLLIHKVAGSSAALGQILAVKLYENLTYCHSVNVATLSLLIGRQIGLDESAIAALGEASLLHDLGKMRIPLDVLRKPGALDRGERRLMESHTTLGAELLVEIAGLRPLTPTVALEHHRGVDGGGYPDLASAVPHVLSQIVSVADIYEAMTGARSYQLPATPEQACLVLARLAGTKLNTSLVKSFVNAITFFPVGSLIRTDRDELAVVVRPNHADPLHPVVVLVSESYVRVSEEIDTSGRDAGGKYERHVLETIVPTQALDLPALLAA
jgi:putative nucleotidyltransferase with HDIG domain